MKWKAPGMNKKIKLQMRKQKTDREDEREKEKEIEIEVDKDKFIRKMEWGIWREKILRWLYPHPVVVLLIVIVSSALLVYSFIETSFPPALTYGSYVFAFYALVLVGVRVPAMVRGIKGFLYSSARMKRYMMDKELRTWTSMYIGLAVNLIVAMLKMGMGIYFGSYWLIAVGVYYITLSGMRVWLLHRERSGKHQKDAMEMRMHQLRSYLLCGNMMFFLNVAITGMVIQMIWENEGYEYPGFFIYAVAAYAFYSLIMSIISMVKYWHSSNLILSAVKQLRFATALMALYAMQTAMLTQFGSDEFFRRIANAATGSAVCLVVFAMAVLMVVRASNEIAVLKLERR